MSRSRPVTAETDKEEIEVIDVDGMVKKCCVHKNVLSVRSM